MISADKTFAVYFMFRICQSSNETFDTEYDYIRYKEQTQRPCTGEKKVFYMPRPWGHRIMHGLCVAKQALLCDVWFGEYTYGVA